MNVQKQAQRDAYEYAAAYMSYGEGAGTRRKLIDGTVDYKSRTVPGYQEAFSRAAAEQNMGKHAQKAQRAARNRTVRRSVERNGRAIMTGDTSNLEFWAIVIGGTAVFLHKTGGDKAIIRATRNGFAKVRNRVADFIRTEDPNPPVFNIYHGGLED